jgi:DNA-binding CsgD family transcriptional regulator
VPIYFARRIRHCRTPEEVVQALHEFAKPIAMGPWVWRAPIGTRRGSRRRIPIFWHPSVPDGFKNGFWPAFEKHGPTFLTRYIWRTHRDVTLSEAIRAMKPEPSELWIVELARDNGMRDLLYIPTIEWWCVGFWSPRKWRGLDQEARKPLRDAADAAARRVEELVGRVDGKEDPRLTRREREVLRLLKDDLSQREVARRLKIKPSSVYQLVRRSKNKLGATSVSGAIAEAVRYYIIL